MLLLGKSADKVHDVPDFIRLQAAFFAHHFAFAIVDDGVDVAIGKVFQRRGVAEVTKFQVHVLGQVAITRAFFPMAHGTILAVFLFARRERSGRRLYRVFFLCGFGAGLCFGSGFGFSSGLFFSGFFFGGLGWFLRAALQRQKQRGTHKSTNER